MDKQIIRLNDQSDHGGTMIKATAKFKVNGIVACVSTDLHKCPIKGHGTTQVISSDTFKSGGKAILKIGDKAGCGASLVQGSPDTKTT